MKTLNLHIKNNQIIQDDGKVANFSNNLITVNPNDNQILYINYQNITTNIEINIKQNEQVEIIEEQNEQCQFHKKINIKADGRLFKLTINHNYKTTIIEDVNLAKGAEIEFCFSELEAGVIDNKININLNGRGSRAEIMLVALSANEDCKIVNVYLNHLAPDTYSNFENFGVAKNSSTFISNVWGVIAKGNNNSKTHQSQKIIIIDPKSIGAANPYLLISEDDVEASHAAAIGQINKEHLYYLQSRGITKEAAIKLIIMGYMMPLIVKVKNQKLQKKLNAEIKNRLQ